MRNILKSLFLTAAIAMVGAAAASAADVNVSIRNASAKSIGLDAVSCTGCTSSSTSSIPASSTRVSSANATATATSMTYNFDYSAYYNLVEKGCRGSITLSVSGGIVTGIITSSWFSYTGPATCTETSAPTFNSLGEIDWAVRLNAS